MAIRVEGCHAVQGLPESPLRRNVDRPQAILLVDLEKFSSVLRQIILVVFPLGAGSYILVRLLLF